MHGLAEIIHGNNLAQAEYDEKRASLDNMSFKNAPPVPCHIVGNEFVRSGLPDVNCITDATGDCVGGIVAGKAACMHDVVEVDNEQKCIGETIQKWFSAFPATVALHPYPAQAFARQIMEVCPHGRERSIALTKLREAVMWANASIALAGK